MYIRKRDKQKKKKTLPSIMRASKLKLYLNLKLLNAKLDRNISIKEGKQGVQD